MREEVIGIGNLVGRARYKRFLQRLLFIQPHYTAAAAKLRENSKVAMAAVDCTKYNPVCQTHGVQGFPTLKYFNYGKTAVAYEGGREEKGKSVPQ